MKRKSALARTGLILAALLFVVQADTGAQNKPAGQETATVTVTAVGKKEGAPPLSRDDVQLFQGKDRKQLGDWKKADQLALMILIDDSIDSGAGSQWDYLKQFILAQPATTLIGLGYVRNNATMLAQDFTADHELVVKGLRLPIGKSAIGGSPYLGLIDMLKRWPKSGVRRSILLISSGIDYFRGPTFSIYSPDLDPLILRAERQNTNVWSIYYPSAGHRGHSFSLVNSGQLNMDKLSNDSGAEAYFLGTGTPVTIKPYLDEITQHLDNQYLLTFAGSGGSKGKYVSVKVKTELPEVEFMTPAAVFFPPAP